MLFEEPFRPVTATHMDHVHVPMLLPGITFDTSPTDYSPVKQVQLRRLEGARWVGFGGIVNSEPPGPRRDQIKSRARLSGHHDVQE
jgi:hypothetical protein